MGDKGILAAKEGGRDETVCKGPFGNRGAGRAALYRGAWDSGKNPPQIVYYTLLYCWPGQGAAAVPALLFHRLFLIWGGFPPARGWGERSLSAVLTGYDRIFTIFPPACGKLC